MANREPYPRFRCLFDDPEKQNEKRAQNRDLNHYLKHKLVNKINFKIDIVLLLSFNEPAYVNLWLGKYFNCS